MFSQSPIALSYPNVNALTYNSDFASVTQFISRNKIIPERLAFFETSQEDQNNIRQLTEAIREGDLKDDVFSHASCELYLLYLLKKELISLTDFLTGYIYISALMQYTTKQAVRDEDIKKESEVDLLQLDDVKIAMLDKFKQYFDKHTYLTIDFDKLHNDINQLNKLDKAIIGIKIPTETQITQDTLFLEDFFLKSPIVFKTQDYYCIPSAALITLMLKATNKDMPVEFAPILGTINLHTLYLLHQLGFHPVGLYSNFIMSNPEGVHQRRVGPLTVLLHDLAGHFPFGNLLSENHYCFLYEYLIPKAAEVLNLNIVDVVKQESDSFLSYEDVTPSLFKLIDLDFNNRSSKYPIKTDADIYLHECLWNALGSSQETKLKMSEAIMNDKEMIKTTYGIDLSSEMLLSLTDTAPTLNLKKSA